ncbi:MAG: hypothetical protein HY332_13950 [Chloroflexi bacterium]|nr:hypothetical protein [Chloroflexota bacterium]
MNAGSIGMRARLASVAVALAVATLPPGAPLDVNRSAVRGIASIGISTPVALNRPNTWVAQTATGVSDPDRHQQQAHMEDFPARWDTSRSACLEQPPAAVPPDPLAGGLWWFDPHGLLAANDGPASPGIWRRTRRGEAWMWSPFDQAVVEHYVVAGDGKPPMPDWPADPTTFLVYRFVGEDGTELGHWVWNAGFFVRLPSGSHQWDPRWQWAPGGEPILLIPEEFPQVVECSFEWI